MSLSRYNADGSLDATFGSGGTMISTIAGNGIAAQYPQSGTANDGKIVEVSGSTVARFNANGSVDTSFGTGGKVTLPWTGTIGGIVVQPDGKVVVSGQVDSTTAPYHVLNVTRLNANGSRDTGFGTSGTWQRTLLVNGYPTHWKLDGSLAIQPDGKLLVTEAESIWLNPGFGWWVDRLTTSGA